MSERRSVGIISRGQKRTKKKLADFMLGLKNPSYFHEVRGTVPVMGVVVDQEV